MKVYEFTRKQFLPISLDEAWDFFSAPQNLKEITPDYMGFHILSDVEGKRMYPGMMIKYIVTPLLGIPMEWLTEITHVKEPYFFVDEQRQGPYSLWHHQHHFKEVEAGVEMTDILHYALPLGPLGRIANQLMVKKKLKEIFDYRVKKTEKIFISDQVTQPQRDSLIIH